MLFRSEACRPVIVVADRPPAEMRPGDRLSMNIHVVSDLRHDLQDAVVTARVESEHDDKTWKWEGDIGADECCRVGSIDVVAPFAPGRITIDLTLECGDVVATNRYVTHITD